jgi:uncharacterized membrane protein (DUF4010 family)
MPDSLRLFETLGIALGLGLLVGLQRERAESRLAGLRTFPLITVFGTLAGFLAIPLGSWPLAAGCLAVLGLAVVGNLHKLQLGDVGGGLTTEIAMLLMYFVGAFLALGPWEVGVAVGVGTAALLQFKPELHGVAARLGDEDLRGIMQFALITFVILPILPNRTYGPFDVLNPFQIWLMVVLIVGISTVGFVSYRFFGRNAGLLLGGILGGAVSSTATTVSYARRTATEPSLAGQAAVVIAIASCVVCVRVLIEIAVTAPSFFPQAAIPVLAMLLLTAIPVAMQWRSLTAEGSAPAKQKNPAELRTAIAFAGLYAGVLWVMAAAKEYLGHASLYTVAALSGLTDLDAITLSTSRLVADGRVDPVQGWRLVLLANVSNLAFKASMATLLGGRLLGWRLVLMFAPVLVGGFLMVLFGAPLAPLFESMVPRSLLGKPSP